MSYGLYIGRNHTADGIAYLAGYGDEPSSHWLEIVPAADHAPGAGIRVGVTPQADLPGSLSEIPQVAHTFRHLRVSYSHYLGVPAPLTNGGLNEHGVAVRDIWSSSRDELIALTPADQTGPNYSDLARLVLERARSAREGVDLIAALIAEHGYADYGGNSHLIADADEAWVVIEFSGGKGLWVAERLGPDSIRASRPGYVGVIPAAPNADFLFPPHFIETAVALGWYDPAQGPFDVNAVYGDGKGRWDGVQWIEGEMARRAARPEKIGLADIAWAIATEKLTGDTAGYGQIVPLATPVHPDLRILWHAPVGAVTAPLVPVALGITEVPAEFAQHRYLTDGEAARFQDERHAVSRPDTLSHVPQGVEATRSAVHVYKRLMQLCFQAPAPFLAETFDHWRRTEQHLAAELADVLKSAEILLAAGEQRLARRLLTDHAATRLLHCLDAAEALVSAALVRQRVMGALNLDRVPKRPEQIW
ncbi:peptidase C69-like protein [Dongia mobilis]|uniref:Dipeptidase n=1 Tax=Dongia mobilis TaxID=578943 RepID=A0A4R6WQZ3_9PROT|nr:C69 family dipeptidase [Dongia mobilis]TDQ81937.1 peptidase C69-like protein [Dongia mobilis]